MSQPLLQVRDLRTYFSRTPDPVRAVDGISYTVRRGEAVAVVGESGSGKSVGVRSLLRLLPGSAYHPSGNAIFDGEDLLQMSERGLRAVRGRRIGMVFQNAMEAMNPTISLQRQLTEHLLWHDVCGKKEAKQRAIHALGSVGIPEPERRVRMYPFQLSGGMRQRAMIAMAMAAEPDLLIADEPTTAVDVTVQRELLDLLTELKNNGTSIIMITHDLGVARYFCDDVLVMYGGRVVEQGPMSEFLDAPAHPYSQGLIASSLEIGTREHALVPIPGSPPDLSRPPDGCPFHPRCPNAEFPRCQAEQELVVRGDDRHVACWKVVSGV